MSTPKLPFYEKDAMRWRDHAHLCVNELKTVIRNTISPSATTHMEAIVWQLTAIVDDIDNTLRDRKDVGKPRK